MKHTNPIEAIKAIKKMAEIKRRLECLKIEVKKTEFLTLPDLETERRILNLALYGAFDVIDYYLKHREKLQKDKEQKKILLEFLNVVFLLRGSVNKDREKKQRRLFGLHRLLFKIYRDIKNPRNPNFPL